MGDTNITVDQLFDLLKKLTAENKTTETTTNNNINLPENLSHNNYTTWARLMYLSIGGIGRLDHITTGRLLDHLVRTSQNMQNGLRTITP